MSSHLRGMVVMVALFGVLACSRTSSTDASKWSFPKAAKTSADTSWQVKCDALCDLKAKAATLDGLCHETSHAAEPKLGATRCEARKANGFPAIPASAVSDAAILELSVAGKSERTAFLALKTAKGWQLARPLGTASQVKALSAQPVDVPGIAPAGVELQVALHDATGSKTERLFVCGLTGEGAMHCPVAIEVASNKSSFAQMGANVGNAIKGPEWRVQVELTPNGYVAKKVEGSVPDGLTGEHGWDSVPH